MCKVLCCAFFGANLVVLTPQKTKHERPVQSHSSRHPRIDSFCTKFIATNGTVFLCSNACSKVDSKKCQTPLLKEVCKKIYVTNPIVDDMGTRIDDLEKSIGELMSQV